MNYPIWDAPVGYGVLMGAIAVVHVFISHFAIGGGLYLVVTEHLVRRQGRDAALDPLRDLTRFFVLLTLVGGALTGVGIWFVIGLLSPAGTEMLIHNFVWGWAIEWTFFVVEIAAALFYYYGWTRLPARLHLVIGWIYFGAAWMSLVVIDGILAFMLTPGDWLSTGSFWDGFFNPTYASSLVLRTGICVMLAGLFTLFVASRRPPGHQRTRWIRYNTLWGLAGLGIVVPSFTWFVSTIPAEILETARVSMPWPTTWSGRTGTLALVLAGALLLVVFGNARRFGSVGAAALLALGFAWFGSFEMFRESIRKPWIVHGYMYGNGIVAGDVEVFQDEGLLAHMAFSTGDEGRDLFLGACRSCHTLEGYKALESFYAGTDAEFIAGTIRGIHRMTGNMPPFAGTGEESEILAAWIESRTDRRPLGEFHQLSGAELGKKAWDVRCGSCHVPGGPRDILSGFEGWTASDVSDFLDMAGDLNDEMPPYTGDDSERELLVAHLMTLAEGGGA